MGYVTPDGGLDRPAHYGGPVLGIAAAVRTTGTSRTTLQRRLKAGEIPGAHHGPDGTWQIPISGLVAAGMMPATTPPDPAPTPPRAPEDTPPAGEPTVPTEVAHEAPTTSPDVMAELAQLRDEVAALRLRAEVAETAAAERERALGALELALATMARALPPAPTGEPTDPPTGYVTTTPGEPTGSPRRRRWSWGRG